MDIWSNNRTSAGQTKHDTAPAGTVRLSMVLFSEESGMYQLSLPEKPEGRFTFTSAYGEQMLPISVTAEQGRWVAHTGSTGRFFIGGNNMGTDIELHDKMLCFAVYGQDTYPIYIEAEHDHDRMLVPYYIEPNSRITLGRQQGNDICYENPLVSRTHASFYCQQNEWYVRDENSTNGVYVNGRKIQETVLKPGDIVYIMGLIIVMGKEFIAMNNANGRVMLCSPRVRPHQALHDISYTKLRGDATAEPLFSRSPRMMYIPEYEPIQIESPPPSLSSQGSMLKRFANPALSTGRAVLTGSLLNGAFSLLSPLLTNGLTEKERKEYEENRTALYGKYLLEKERELRTEQTKEESFLRQLYPELSVVCGFPQEKQRLWERRRADSDFLTVRVGSGKLPLMTGIEVAEEKLEMEQDPLEDKMRALARQDFSLRNVPITFNLREDFISGISGPYDQRLNLAKAMLTQLAITHSYEDLKIVILGDSKCEKLLDDFKYLPHLWNDNMDFRYFASDSASAAQIGRQLETEFEGVFSSNNDNSDNLLRGKPAYVVFAFNSDLVEHISILKRVSDRREYCGISLVSAEEPVDKYATRVAYVTGSACNLIKLDAGRDTDRAFRQDECAQGIIHDALRIVMKTRVQQPGSAAGLPKTYSFLEMYGAGKVEHLNPLERWKNSNPIKSLACPVGIGTDGKLFNLDLHQKSHGPHGLVAGMTGSGKSEWIITYILSMAVSYSPDEVAFVLIDYKGGGLTTAFEDPERGIHLPHIAGTITNLDGAAISRSMVAIHSELKRRQAVFNKAKSANNEGTMDIYDYQKLYRAGKVSEPMPHLFIVSDEFAELKSQQPEFMDELISTARIGRSLGVHLILATQKPSGVVNEQIWSNSHFHICLKVQDRVDSMDMLKRPEAADIKETGRFYMQVGYNEYFALGQSAWCGADYVPMDELVPEKDESIDFLGTVGDNILNVKPQKEKKTSGTKQLVAIVQYLSDLAKRENINVRRLWTDPLPARLDTAEIEYPKTDAFPEALIGMIDDPGKQAKYPFVLKLDKFRHMLLCGETGSGKSTFIKTMILSLADRYSPEEFGFYALDMSGGALGSLAKLPHCGAYLTENNEQDFARLLKKVQALVAERQKLFAAAGVFNYEAYRQLKPLPFLLVVIDGFQNIEKFKATFDYKYKLDTFMKEPPSYGIHFVLTANVMEDMAMSVSGATDLRLALKAKDRYDYGSILQTIVGGVIPDVPGRGMCLIDKQPLEYHVAVNDAQCDDLTRNSRYAALIQKTAEKWKGCRADYELPVISNDEDYESFCSGFAAGRLPLGYYKEDMRKIALPLKQLHTVSVYMGSRNSRPKVLGNIIYALARENMRVLVYKKKTGSVLNENDPIWNKYFPDGGIAFRTCPNEFAASIIDDLEIPLGEKIKYRDEYCEANGIPDTDPERNIKAGNYIAANTYPVAVVFESFGDLQRADDSADSAAGVRNIFTASNGINLYFVAGFYPEDERDVYRGEYAKAFTAGGIKLFFGGRYDKQALTESMYNMKAEIEDSRQMLMLYQDNLYSLVMPEGDYAGATGDNPDEMPII